MKRHEGTVFKPLSQLEAAINQASPGDLLLLMIAMDKRDKALKGQMKIHVSPFHRKWELGGGVYEITMDVRHSTYDVSKNNVQVFNTNYFQHAVEWVMKDQGWDGSIDISKHVSSISRDLFDEAAKLVQKAVALGQMKENQ